jgi:CheY-like chemotaxis protein
MTSNSLVYVLVVEDDFLSRLHAVNLVEDAGYIAIEASNADEAITILEALRHEQSAWAAQAMCAWR